MKILDMVGRIYKNNIGLEFEVLKFLYNKKAEYYFEIKFLKSKSVRIASHRNIRNGSVRDIYHRNIYNVACKGNVSSVTPEFNKIAFKRWYAMIERCYNESAIGYNAYGSNGVSVSDRWLIFENFIKDIVEIEGFDKELYMSGEIQLDKDIKYKGNKMYSNENCIFVTTYVNKSNKPRGQKDFIAYSPDGKVYEFNNQTECARQFGLTARTIGKVLAKQLNTHKGWRFEYKK